MNPPEPCQSEINADREDPRDSNFAYTGKFLVVRYAKDNVKWTRIYLPTPACRAWDNPPEEVNVAIGVRFGWTYATLRVTGKQPVRVPGGGYAVGKKGKLVTHSNSFFHGWETEGPFDCWVVVVPAGPQ